MRYLFAAVLVASSVCFADGQSTNDVPLKVEHHQWEAAHGQTRYRDEYYRGGQHILRVVRFQNVQTQQWEIWRFYYVDGEVVMLEDDLGAGKPVTISLIKHDATYDAFTRLPDGSVQPVSNDELAKIQAREKDLLGADYPK